MVFAHIVYSLLIIQRTRKNLEKISRVLSIRFTEKMGMSVEKIAQAIEIDISIVEQWLSDAK